VTHDISPSPWGSIGDFVNRTDGKLPWILPGALIGVVLATVLGGILGIHFDHESWQAHTWHKIKHTSHLSLWIFFLYLGLEVRLRQLRASGAFVFLTIVGGMVVPLLFCSLLLFLVDVPMAMIIPIAMGAMATDVAFSVSCAKMANQMVAPGKTFLVILTAYCLSPLAIGDDLGGVGAMTGAYTEGILLSAATTLTMFLGTLYWLGEGGRIEGDFEIGNWKKRNYILHVRIKTPAFWIFAAVLATVIIMDVGVEAIIGGCLAMIIASDAAKDRLLPWIQPLVPPVLFVFGLTACAINVLNPEAWGWVTLATLLGGHLGKIMGIFGFGILGRWLLSRRNTKNSDGEPEDKINWAAMPTGQIATLSLWAGVTGTVAIIFVETALKKGMITPEYATQATLGFALSILALYTETFLIAKIPFLRNWFFKESPDFQPPQPTQAEESEEDNKVLALA
jgi:Kef-type K+ transport system membrane component KefB